MRSYNSLWTEQQCHALQSNTLTTWPQCYILKLLPSIERRNAVKFSICSVKIDSQDGLISITAQKLMLLDLSKGTISYIFWKCLIFDDIQTVLFTQA